MLKLEKYTKDSLTDLFKTGVYKITCLQNNKIYIGSASSIKNSSRTKIGFYFRWSLHIRDLEKNVHRNKYLQNSWNKYGSDNFIFEIIEITEPYNAENREIYWCNFYNSYDQNFGFNILKGSLSFKKNRTISTRKKISNALIGKPRSIEINNHLRKPVLQYDLNDNLINEYKSVSEASKFTPCARQAIYKCCIGKYKTSYGFKWKYKNENFITKVSSTYRKHIFLLDLNLNKIKEYSSIVECSKDLNFCRSTIRFYLNSEFPLNEEFYLKT
jgi:group I intron endonuclease